MKVNKSMYSMPKTFASTEITTWYENWKRWKPNKFVLTIFLGIFLSLPSIFFWKSRQLQRSLDKGVSGKRIRIHQKGNQFTKNKVVEIGGRSIQFTQQSELQRHMGCLYFLIYCWSSELNTDFCQLLLCPDSTNSHLLIIYREVIFVHLHTTVDTLCNCILGTCHKSSLVHEF